MSSFKDEHDEEHDAFLSRRGHLQTPTPAKADSRSVMWYLRLALEFLMAFIIVGLLVRPPPASCDMSKKRSPVPNCMLPSPFTK